MFSRAYSVPHNGWCETILDAIVPILTVSICTSSEYPSTSRLTSRSDQRRSISTSDVSYRDEAFIYRIIIDFPCSNAATSMTSTQLSRTHTLIGPDEQERKEREAIDTSVGVPVLEATAPEEQTLSRVRKLVVLGVLCSAQFFDIFIGNSVVVSLPSVRTTCQ